MSEYDWIIRSERAKTRKPKGQYLYDDFKDDETGLVNGVEQVEYKWRKEHETPFKNDYKSDEPRIDFQGPVYDDFEE